MEVRRATPNFIRIAQKYRALYRKT